MLDSPYKLCALALFAGFVPNSLAPNRFKVGGTVIYTKATDLIFLWGFNGSHRAISDYRTNFMIEVLIHTL